MDREAIKALINRAYEARDNDDIEGTIALFHPQANVQIAGSPEHAKAAATAQGNQEVRQTLERLVATFQFAERTIVSTLIDGDSAAVRSRVQVRFIPKNLTVTTDLLDLWRFENGKVVGLVEFADTALVNYLLQ
jgi:ketosteroid isomerase-like protein